MSSFNAAAVSLASPRREDDFTGDDEALATGQGWQTLATGLEDTGQAWKTLATVLADTGHAWKTLATGLAFSAHWPGRHWPGLEDTYWPGLADMAQGKAIWGRCQLGDRTVKTGTTQV